MIYGESFQGSCIERFAILKKLSPQRCCLAVIVILFDHSTSTSRYICGKDGDEHHQELADRCQ